MEKFFEKSVDIWRNARYNIKAVTENVRRQIEVWLSLVERFVRDEEAAGSNPVTSTNGGKPLKACRLFFSFTQTGFEKMKKVLTKKEKLGKINESKKWTLKINQ